jgi:hypothetical protein
MSHGEKKFPRGVARPRAQGLDSRAAQFRGAFQLNLPGISPCITRCSVLVFESERDRDWGRGRVPRHEANRVTEAF